MSTNMLDALKLCLPILLEEKEVLVKSYAVGGSIDSSEDEAINRCVKLNEAIDKARAAIAAAEAKKKEPRVRRYTVDVCTPCMELAGEECHTPGCIFFLCGMKQVSEYLNRMLLRPIVDGVQWPQLEPGEPVGPLPDDEMGG